MCMLTDNTTDGVQLLLVPLYKICVQQYITLQIEFYCCLEQVHIQNATNVVQLY